MNIYEIACNILKIQKCKSQEEFEKLIEETYPCNLIFRQIIGNDLDNETSKMLWALISQTSHYLKEKHNIKINLF